VTCGALDRISIETWRSTASCSPF